MKMTKELLGQLGACGDYVRTFIRLFPTSDERYADGVEITPEVCVANSSDFSWSWAAEIMLSHDAYDRWSRRSQGDEYRALVAQRDQAYQTHNDEVNDWRAHNAHSYGEPNRRTSEGGRASYNAIQRKLNDAVTDVERRLNELGAQVFGELFQDVTNQSSRIATALEQAERARVDNERRELRDARNLVERLGRDREHWTTQPAVELARIEEALPKAEAEVERLEQRRRTHDLVLARSRAATAQRALEVAEQNSKNARDVVAEAEKAVAEAEKAADAVTAEA